MLDDLIDSLGLAEFLDSQDVSRVEKRLIRVEAMLEVLLAHHGIEIPDEAPPAAAGGDHPASITPEVSAEVLDLVRRGQKSAAVERYKEASGVSREQAQSVIDRLDGSN